MHACSLRAPKLAVASAVALIAGALASTAHAGLNPLTINLSVDGGAVGPFIDLGTPNGAVGDNRIEYIGSHVDTDYTVSWQIFADVNPGEAFGQFQGVGLSGTLTVYNTSASAHDFELDASVALNALLANPMYGGSLSISMLSSNEGGAGTDMVLSTLTGQPMYSAGINAGTVQSFIADPSSFNVPAGQADAVGPMNYGLPGPTIPGPNSITSMSHSFAFGLTGSTPESPLGPDDYDYVTFAFSLVITPAPGAVALLGFAGLIGGRRRRTV
jgi:hypothetical protein